MRFGIFSDVHANIEALSAVMRGFEDEDIDEYYCLGDVVGYGASPNECSDLVRETAKVTILGNHDAAVCGRMNYAFYYDAARNALTAQADPRKGRHGGGGPVTVPLLEISDLTSRKIGSG